MFRSRFLHRVFEPSRISLLLTATCLLSSLASSGVFGMKLEMCHQNPCENGGSCFRIGDMVENHFCDAQSTPYLNSCYYFSATPETWSKAKENCGSVQASLVSVDSQAEREFLELFARQQLNLHSQLTGSEGPKLGNFWTAGRAKLQMNGQEWSWAKINYAVSPITGPFFWQENEPKRSFLLDRGNRGLSGNYTPGAAIWTSGRFEQVEHGFGLYWNLEPYSSKAPVTEGYWAENEPNYDIVSADACISITADSGYKSWAVQHCEQEQNFYICEKPEERPDASSQGAQLYPYQCRCIDGYMGINCELAPEPDKQQQASQQIICGNKPLSIRCPSLSDSTALSIIVEYSAYGRSSVNAPAECNVPVTEIDCIAENSLSLLIQRCQGQQQCDLPQLNQVFTTSPCMPGTAKYLEYRVRCEKDSRSCPAGSESFNGRCFELFRRDDVKNRKGWADAQDTCLQKGGNLVGPIDNDFHQFIAGRLDQAADSRVKYYWIGLKSSFSDFSDGVWVNGQPVSAYPLASDAIPNDGERFHNGECVAYYVQSGRSSQPGRSVWLARNCQQPSNWICEYFIKPPERPKLDPSSSWATPAMLIPPGRPRIRTTTTPASQTAETNVWQAAAEVALPPVTTAPPMLPLAARTRRTTTTTSTSTTSTTSTTMTTTAATTTSVAPEIQTFLQTEVPSIAEPGLVDALTNQPVLPYSHNNIPYGHAPLSEVPQPPQLRTVVVESSINSFDPLTEATLTQSNRASNRRTSPRLRTTRTTQAAELSTTKVLRRSRRPRTSKSATTSTTAPVLSTVALTAVADTTTVVVDDVVIIDQPSMSSDVSNMDPNVQGTNEMSPQPELFGEPPPDFGVVAAQVTDFTASSDTPTLFTALPSVRVRNRYRTIATAVYDNVNKRLLGTNGSPSEFGAASQSNPETPLDEVHSSFPTIPPYYPEAVSSEIPKVVSSRETAENGQSFSETDPANQPDMEDPQTTLVRPSAKRMTLRPRSTTATTTPATSPQPMLPKLEASVVMTTDTTTEETLKLLTFPATTPTPATSRTVCNNCTNGSSLRNCTPSSSSGSSPRLTIPTKSRVKELPQTLPPIILGSGSCPATTVRNVEWPTIQEGATAHIRCPQGTVGIAVWRCANVNGSVRYHPELPDLSACHHSWVDDLEAQLDKKRHALKIIEDLKDRLQMTDQLYGGDIEGLISIAQRSLVLQDRQLRLPARGLSLQDRTLESKNFTNGVGFMVDSLLRSNSLQAWADLPADTRILQLTRLMETLESSASLLSKNLAYESELEFQFPNLAIKVQISPVLDDDAAGLGAQQSNSNSNNNRPSNANSQHFADSEQFPTSGQSGSMKQFNSNAKYASPGFTEAADSFAFRGERSSISLPGQGLKAKLLATDFLHSTSLGSPIAGIPGGRFRAIDDAPADMIRIGYYLYKSSLHKLLTTTNRTTVVNSEVIGATINDPGRSIILPPGQNVTLRLQHLETKDLVNPRCAFWNFSQSSWDVRGCSVEKTTDQYTICSCNHLTSFAVLMDVTGVLESLPDVHQRVLKWLTRIGCGISALCLLLCIATFSLFPSLWNDRNTIHRNLCFCLFVGELLFLFGIEQTENESVCTAIATILHLVFLSAFFWMLMEGYMLYQMLVRVFESERSKALYFYIASYGCPLIIIAISAGVRLKDYGTKDYCWINVKSSTIWAFVVPIAVVILTNTVFLVVALRVVFHKVVPSTQARTNSERIKGWLKGSTLLLCLLGTTWIFGFFFVIEPAAVGFAYIFTILNCLQGVFIFIFHVLFNEKVQVALTQCLRAYNCACCLPDKYELSSNNTNSTGSNNSNNMRKDCSLANSSSTVSSSAPVISPTTAPFVAGTKIQPIVHQYQFLDYAAAGQQMAAPTATSSASADSAAKQRHGRALVTQPQQSPHVATPSVNGNGHCRSAVQADSPHPSAHSTHNNTNRKKKKNHRSSSGENHCHSGSHHSSGTSTHHSRPAKDYDWTLQSNKKDCASRRDRKAGGPKPYYYEDILDYCPMKERGKHQGDWSTQSDVSDDANHDHNNDDDIQDRVVHGAQQRRSPSPCYGRHVVCDDDEPYTDSCLPTPPPSAELKADWMNNGSQLTSRNGSRTIDPRQSRCSSYIEHF